MNALILDDVQVLQLDRTNKLSNLLIEGESLVIHCNLLVHSIHIEFNLAAYNQELLALPKGEGDDGIAILVLLDHVLVQDGKGLDIVFVFVSIVKSRHLNMAILQKVDGVAGVPIEHRRLNVLQV